MPEQNHVDTQHDEDAAHLASLGYNYDTTFKREMGFWGNVSLGFTYLSPIAGVYAMFAFSFMSAGPPMAWALVIALVGQFSWHSSLAKWSQITLSLAVSTRGHADFGAGSGPG